MRRIAPLGYWMLRLMRSAGVLVILWVVATIVAFFTMGGLYAVIPLLVALVHLNILASQGWMRYYPGEPLKSEFAFPENDQ